MAAPIWHRFPCKIKELRLDRVLICGQSFRWKEHTSGTWTGVIGDAVWQLRQTEDELFYRTFRQLNKVKSAQKIADVKACIKKEIQELPRCTNFDLTRSKDTKPVTDEHVLKDYFNLSVNLERLYKTWSDADENFKRISHDFSGIRMLRQDPVECLFAFICSSNNHISRISSMVEKLAVHYGEKITEVDGVEYFRFPRVSALAKNGVEERLRELGFGYRAKYIQKSAQYIEENGGEAWLFSLRSMEYSEAKLHLMKLCGVGAKVADCVSLMCLDQTGSIPVDTHVWQIAARDYMPQLRHAKSLTDKLYQDIGNHFRELWGPYAGWAHSVLFTADLKQFKDKSPQKSVDNKRKTQTKVETVTKPKKRITRKTIKTEES